MGHPKHLFDLMIVRRHTVALHMLHLSGFVLLVTDIRDVSRGCQKIAIRLLALVLDRCECLVKSELIEAVGNTRSIAKSHNTTRYRHIGEMIQVHPSATREASKA